MEWHHALGLTPAKLRWHQHGPDELAHYARAAFDIQYEFPFGWQEIEGIHNRGDFDLGRHQEFSGKKLEYFDQAGERALSAVHRRDLGRRATASTLTLLVDAYREETVEGETRVVLGFHPAIAPIKAGVFPLVKKDGMPELAHGAVSRSQAPLPGVLRRQRRDRPALPPDGRGGHAVRHHGRRRHGGTADRDGASPGLDAAGARRAGSGGRLRRGAAGGLGGLPWGDTMRLADFEAMVVRMAGEVPREFLDGVGEIVVSPRTLPHPERPGIFTLGECIPLPAAAGGGAEGVQSRVVLYHGSFAALARGDTRLRLAGGGVRDAHPRAAAPPRVAGPRARSRGARLGRRAELRAPGRRGVRSRLLPRRGAGGRGHLARRGRRLSRSRGARACPTRWPFAGRAGNTRDRAPGEHACRRSSCSRASPIHPPASWSLVLRRKPGVLSLLRPVRRYHAAVRAAEAPHYLPDASPHERGD